MTRDTGLQEGSLLCFDEVMTGFRISRGCAQEHFGVTPDICTMGKVIGGGLPVGAYGGSKEIMRTVAPAGPMYQSGTSPTIDAFDTLLSVSFACRQLALRQLRHGVYARYQATPGPQPHVLPSARTRRASCTHQPASMHLRV